MGGSSESLMKSSVQFQSSASAEAVPPLLEPDSGEVNGQRPHPTLDVVGSMRDKYVTGDAAKAHEFRECPEKTATNRLRIPRALSTRVSARFGSPNGPIFALTSLIGASARIPTEGNVLIGLS